MQNDNSLFVDFFGNYPIIRTIDFLIENDIFDYSKKDIANNSNVSWNTLENFWKTLEEKEIVTYTRKVGKARMYKLNSENPIVKQLMELDKQFMRKSLNEEKIRAVAR